MPNCPVCNREAEIRAGGIGDQNHVTCATCGRFEMTREAIEDWPAQTRRNSELIQLLSHTIRKMQRDDGPPLIDNALIDRISREVSLPPLAEQTDNFILWLGDTFKTPEETINIDKLHCSAVIGASNPSTVAYVAKHLNEQGYIKLIPRRGLDSVPLTFKGWQRYEELRRLSVDSRIGFMAMPFNNALLDRLFVEFYIPAVNRAGFDLRRIDENPPAGSIDNRLRVEIRKARFLVAELTGDNSGVYWESGYAEGLGKPVIYSCEKSYFDEIGTHFDTQHWHTILWVEGEMANAAESLTATIRATLPNEAKLNDDE